MFGDLGASDGVGRAGGAGGRREALQTRTQPLRRKGAAHHRLRGRGGRGGRGARRKRLHSEKQRDVGEEETVAFTHTKQAPMVFVQNCTFLGFF